MSMNRRSFLKVLGAGAGAAFVADPILRAFADGGASREYFILIHASGGWDVTLWSDPRNQDKGLVDPATDVLLTTAGITNWVDLDMGGGASTFKIVQKGNYQLGPTMGTLVDLYDRFTLVNGISMNTVSHPDGTYFSSTGRHLAGGRPVAASIDTMLANEFGREAILPVVSVNYPSTFLGSELDQRVIPLRVSDITSVSKSLARSALYTTDAERSAVTAMLSDEAAELASTAFRPDVPMGLSLQFDALQKMLGPSVNGLFNATALKQAHPGFNYTGRFQGGPCVNAAFAIEAIKRGMVRCVSFAAGGFDTHNSNYKNQGLTQQELFELVAQLVREMDQTTFEGSSDKLSDHVHILVVSEFCRTPQVNLNGGRDHYPNNSALIVSPRFRGNTVFGKSDPDQLLPMDAGVFSDGMRAPTPADVLATFLGAFGVDPRKYMRDGDVIKELLK